MGKRTRARAYPGVFGNGDMFGCGARMPYDEFATLQMISQ